MLEPAHPQLKPVAMRGAPADARALAQVEKWMAMIREFSREQQGLSKLRV